MKKKPRAWICTCRRKNEANKRVCVYCGERKLGDKKSLIGKLDRIFSEYIRLRDGKFCISCQTPNPYVQAGHYIKRGKMSTRWHEKNVHSQCVRCNKYLDGNQAGYALALESYYGYGILQELDDLSKQKFNPSRAWLKEKIDYYKEKVDGYNR